MTKSAKQEIESADINTMIIKWLEYSPLINRQDSILKS